MKQMNCEGKPVLDVLNKGIQVELRRPRMTESDNT